MQIQDSRTGSRIGLIGGLAPRAGIYYYEQLIQRHTRLGRPAEIMLNHADIGRVLAAVNARDITGLGAYLGALSNALFDGGASVVAVTAVAPHIAIDAITSASRCPVLNVLDSIVTGVSERGLKRLTIFGNHTVMQTNAFGAVRPDMVVKLGDSEMDLVHATYTDIALHGKRNTNVERDVLSALAWKLVSRGAEAIVLAGTDFSSFYADKKPDYPFLDVADLHIDAIMRQITS